MHGRMSQVHQTKKNVETGYNDILNDCSFPFWAVRYHSLVVDEDCKLVNVRTMQRRIIN